MDKLRVLIADSDHTFTQQVSQALQPHDGIEIVAIEHSGEHAFHQVVQLKPDVVLFDLILPQMDGLTLLKRINELPQPPATICCTRFYSDVSIEAVRRFKASYVMYKPIELRTLHAVIVHCHSFHLEIRRNDPLLLGNEPDAARQLLLIRNYIVSLGIPSKLVGCNYLAEAVRLANIDLSLMRNLSKGLYLEIARIMDTTPIRIERSIRNAISTAYASGRLDMRLLNCPSNKEFINFVIRTMNF